MPLISMGTWATGWNRLRGDAGTLFADIEAVEKFAADRGIRLTIHTGRPRRLREEPEEPRGQAEHPAENSGDKRRNRRPMRPGRRRDETGGDEPDALPSSDVEPVDDPGTQTMRQQG